MSAAVIIVTGIRSEYVLPLPSLPPAELSSLWTPLRVHATPFPQCPLQESQPWLWILFLSDFQPWVVFISISLLPLESSFPPPWCRVFLSPRGGSPATVTPPDSHHCQIGNCRDFNRNPYLSMSELIMHWWIFLASMTPQNESLYFFSFLHSFLPALPPFFLSSPFFFFW